jgi:hypothetical protein
MPRGTPDRGAPHGSRRVDRAAEGTAGTMEPRDGQREPAEQDGDVAVPANASVAANVLSGAAIRVEDADAQPTDLSRNTGS